MSFDDKLLTFAVFIGIFVLVGLIVNGILNPDERPTRCFEGFLYSVNHDGSLDLRTSGKARVPVRCEP